MDAKQCLVTLHDSGCIVTLAHYDRDFCDGRGHALVLDEVSQTALMCQDCGDSGISAGAFVRYLKQPDGEPKIVGEPVPLASLGSLESCKLEFEYRRRGSPFIQRAFCNAIVINAVDRIAVTLEACGNADETRVAAGAFVKYSGLASAYPKIDGTAAYARTVLLGGEKIRSAI